MVKVNVYVFHNHVMSFQEFNSYSVITPLVDNICTMIDHDFLNLKLQFFSFN